MKINNFTGLEKLLTKFIEVVSSVIEKVYEPTHTLMIAKAKKESFIK